MRGARTAAFLAAAVGLTSALCGCDASRPSAEAEQELPVFSIRGITQETLLSDALAVVKDCQESAGEQWCVFQDPTVAGGYALKSEVIFADDGFRMMFVDFHPNSFEDVSRGLTSAYGPPCSSRSQELSNAFGASFVDEILIWCFKDGRLRFRKYDDRIDKSALYFSSNLGAAAPAETYTPDTL